MEFILSGCAFQLWLRLQGWAKTSYVWWLLLTYYVVPFGSSPILLQWRKVATSPKFVRHRSLPNPHGDRKSPWQPEWTSISIPQKSCSPRCARSARARQKEVQRNNQDLNQELIPLKARKSKTQVWWVLGRYMCLQARQELTYDLILPCSLPQGDNQKKKNNKNVMHPQKKLTLELTLFSRPTWWYHARSRIYFWVKSSKLLLSPPAWGPFLIN